jgi:hypothetical protein
MKRETSGETRHFTVMYQGHLAAQLVCQERGQHHGCIMGYALARGSRWDGWVISSDTIMEMVCGNVEQINTAIKAVAERWTRNSEPVTPAAPSEPAPSLKQALIDHRAQMSLEIEQEKAARAEPAPAAEPDWDRATQEAKASIKAADEAVEAAAHRELIERTIERANREVAAQPPWMRNILRHSAEPTNSVPREPVNNLASEPADKTTQSGSDVGIAGRELSLDDMEAVLANDIRNIDGGDYPDPSELAEQLIARDWIKREWATTTSVKREEVGRLQKKLDGMVAVHQQRNIHELYPNLPHCECPVCNVHRRLDTATTELSRLRTELEQYKAAIASGDLIIKARSTVASGSDGYCQVIGTPNEGGNGDGER